MTWSNYVTWLIVYAWPVVCLLTYLKLEVDNEYEKFSIHIMNSSLLSFFANLHSRVLIT